jgi:hypothetical protein
MLKQWNVSRVEQRWWRTIRAKGIGTMLFQHHRYVTIFLRFYFMADSFFLLNVHWWQRVFFLVWDDVLCCVQVSICFFWGLLVIPILIYFLGGLVVEVSFNLGYFMVVTNKTWLIKYKFCCAPPISVFGRG